MRRLSKLIFAIVLMCAALGPLLWSAGVPPALGQGVGRATLEILGDSKDPHALKVLFIGNSFTFVNQLPLMFCVLASAGDPKRPLKVYEVAGSNFSLSNHLRDGLALKVMNEQGPWDFVVLQEQSGRPMNNPELMIEALHQWEKLIKPTQAKIAVIEAWVDKRALKFQPEYSKRIISAANGIGAAVVPVGRAWLTVLEKDRDAPLWELDGHHPGIAGTYLTACVFYASFTDKSPVGLPRDITLSESDTNKIYPYANLPQGLATTLQKAAWQSVHPPQKTHSAPKSHH